MNHKQVACAICRSAHRTVVLVKPGDSQCPEKWTKEYNGFLMAPGIDDPKAEYVCVDVHMQQAKGNITFGTDEGTHIFKIQEVSVMCGGLPCGPYQADKPIPCVVCTV
ncbi:uncharacterized protein CEXT_655221 [Caerostris extrusa]|uniref:Uncharacterized protein n=1 Tax=Caerostris extrusa TaxID=172846 RepID=A0AAV4R0N5_CAEEX|nr:uncharacterized protein CEXT_655221 [Caerostris extrusa]